MEPFEADILVRSRQFCERFAVELHRRLGFGKDGSVWETTGDAALKVFRRPEPFERELAAYQRLAMHRILKIRVHHVPQLLRFDRQLLALEMTIVPRPFVLDFGSAYLDDAAPQFPDEVMEHWFEQKQQEFGARWPDASRILSALKGYGIHLTDVHPGNIAFSD